MRQEHILEDLLGRKSKVAILRLLSQEQELTGREIARKVHLSPRAAHQALQDLHSKDILHRRPAGASYLFSLNSERHVVKNLLLPLFRGESRLFQTIIDELRKTLPRAGVLSLVLFGSAARGRSDYGSDLDVMILVDDSTETEKIAELARERNKDFYKRFGMPISPYAIRASDLISRFDRKDKLIRNIVKEGRVLWGKSLAEVLTLEPKKSPH